MWYKNYCYPTRPVFAHRQETQTPRQRDYSKERVYSQGSHARKQEHEPQIRFPESRDSGIFMGLGARWSEMWREVIGGEERGGN